MEQGKSVFSQPKEKYHTYNWMSCSIRYNPHPDLVSEGWKYHGDSLSQGQCGIQIFDAQVSDTGTWNCGMGVQSEYGTAKDLQNTISVTVAGEWL